MKKQPVADVDYCGKCRTLYGIDHTYCLKCGKPRGDKNYIPDEENKNAYGVYGPPVMTSYRCGKCGKEFNYFTIARDGVFYCPFCCAKKNKIQIVEREFGFELFDKYENWEKEYSGLDFDDEDDDKKD